MAVKEYFVALTATTYPTIPQVVFGFVPDTIHLSHPGGMGTADVAVSFGPEKEDEVSLVVGTSTQALSVATRAQQLFLRLKGAGNVTVQVIGVKDK